MSTTDHPATPLPTTAAQLPDDVPTLQRMVLELLLSLQKRDRAHEALQHRLDQLLRRLYGPRGERFDPNQPLLFAEPEADADADTSAAAAEPPESAAAPTPRRCRFTSTCQRLGVEAWSYLQDVLARLPTTPVGELAALLPDDWQAVHQAKPATPPKTATDPTPPSAESTS